MTASSPALTTPKRSDFDYSPRVVPVQWNSGTPRVLHTKKFSSPSKSTAFGAAPKTAHKTSHATAPAVAMGSGAKPTTTAAGSPRDYFPLPSTPTILPSSTSCRRRLSFYATALSSNNTPNSAPLTTAAVDIWRMTTLENSGTSASHEGCLALARRVVGATISHHFALNGAKAPAEAEKAALQQWISTVLAAAPRPVSCITAYDCYTLCVTADPAALATSLVQRGGRSAERAAQYAAATIERVMPATRQRPCPSRDDDGTATLLWGKGPPSSSPPVRRAPSAGDRMKCLDSSSTHANTAVVATAEAEGLLQRLIQDVFASAAESEQQRCSAGATAKLEVEVEMESSATTGRDEEVRQCSPPAESPQQRTTYYWIGTEVELSIGYFSAGAATPQCMLQDVVPPSRPSQPSGNSDAAQYEAATPAYTTITYDARSGICYTAPTTRLSAAEGGLEATQNKEDDTTATTLLSVPTDTYQSCWSYISRATRAAYHPTAAEGEGGHRQLGSNTSVREDLPLSSRGLADKCAAGPRHSKHPASVKSPPEPKATTTILPASSAGQLPVTCIFLHLNRLYRRSGEAVRPGSTRRVCVAAFRFVVELESGRPEPPMRPHSRGESAEDNRSSGDLALLLQPMLPNGTTSDRASRVFLLGIDAAAPSASSRPQVAPRSHQHRLNQQQQLSSSAWTSHSINMNSRSSSSAKLQRVSEALSQLVRGTHVKTQRPQLQSCTNSITSFSSFRLPSRQRERGPTPTTTTAAADSPVVKTVSVESEKGRRRQEVAENIPLQQRSGPVKLLSSACSSGHSSSASRILQQKEPKTEKAKKSCRPLKSNHQRSGKKGKAEEESGSGGAQPLRLQTPSKSPLEPALTVSTGQLLVRTSSSSLAESSAVAADEPSSEAAADNDDDTFSDDEKASTSHLNAEERAEAQELQAILKRFVFPPVAPVSSSHAEAAKQPMSETSDDDGSDTSVTERDRDDRIVVKAVSDPKLSEPAVRKEKKPASAGKSRQTPVPSSPRTVVGAATAASPERHLVSQKVVMAVPMARRISSKILKAPPLCSTSLILPPRSTRREMNSATTRHPQIYGGVK